MKINRVKGKGIIWEKGQKETIANSYKNGESIHKINMDTGLHHNTIVKILEEFNIEKRTRSTAKSNKIVNNCSVFEKIDSHEKAYWLGVLAADGFVGEKAYNVNLSMCDGEVVYNFADFLEVSRERVKITKPKINNHNIVYELRLQDKKLNQDLKNLGIKPKKSLILKPPENTIPKKYYWDYIRGYFDGDGGVGIMFSPFRKIQLYFTDTKELCEWLLTIFEKTDLNQPFPENKSKGNNTFRVLITGTNEVYKIYNNMYKNSNHNTRMNRKFEVFKTYYTDHPTKENFELFK